MANSIFGTLSPPAGLRPAPAMPQTIPLGSAPTAPATDGRTKVAEPVEGRRNLLDALRRTVAGYCHRHDVGQETLALFGLVLSAAAAMVFLSGHPGLGSLLALFALLSGTLATVPPPWAARSGPLVDGLGSLSDLLVLAGFFSCLARYHQGIVAALAVVVFVLMAWLPLVKARGSALIPKTAGLWRHGDRMAILVLGGLIGRPVPALLVLAAVAGLDAWLRFERLDVPPVAGMPSAPPPKRWLVLEDGSLPALYRWISLAATAALLFVLPTADVWRF